MFPYLPHTEEEIAEMLTTIGVSSIDELFSDIPEAMRLKGSINIPQGISEYEVFRHLHELSEKNITDKVSFLGCGSYDHIVPSTVKHIMGRSEFYTSYTPYQAEISQGILQSIFEYQSLICELTSMDVSNASLYDGHTAASEAAVMALNMVRKSDTILFSETIHPATKQVLKTYFLGTDIKLKEIGQSDGTTSLKYLKENLTPQVAGVIVQSPNFFGYIEDYTGFADAIHDNKSLFVISSNPISLGVLKSQGEWGADIAIGDTQPLGLPQYFGGPTVGYIAAREKCLRKMPGRISGQTVDTDGDRAFVLTLQAREQHIKRERATSNICSNQALAALANAVYLSTVGKEGFQEVSRQNLQKAHYLFERLTGELSLKPLYERPFFNEFSLVLDRKASQVITEMENENILGGVALDRFFSKDFDNVMAVAVTEKRTREELDKYVETLKRILK
ncbi:MAG: aminomethyl-transferring glycine dehydrogenase subunit GcvPA [Spirochaetes bacterium]|nr:MAG: aminomethyl-transferring glycine dehydrogenase subunit GcvPA [Spirochaetota bacterium]